MLPAPLGRSSQGRQGVLPPPGQPRASLTDRLGGHALSPPAGGQEVRGTDFPGGPVVTTPLSNAEGEGSILVRDLRLHIPWGPKTKT